MPWGSPMDRSAAKRSGTRHTVRLLSATVFVSGRSRVLVPFCPRRTIWTRLHLVFPRRRVERWYPQNHLESANPRIQRRPVPYRWAFLRCFLRPGLSTHSTGAVEAQPVAASVAAHSKCRASNEGNLRGVPRFLHPSPVTSAGMLRFPARRTSFPKLAHTNQYRRRAKKLPGWPTSQLVAIPGRELMVGFSLENISAKLLGGF